MNYSLIFIVAAMNFLEQRSFTSFIFCLWDSHIYILFSFAISSVLSNVHSNTVCEQQDYLLPSHSCSCRLAVAISLTVLCCLEVLASLSDQFSVTKCMHFLWGSVAIGIFLPSRCELAWKWWMLLEKVREANKNVCCIPS